MIADEVTDEELQRWIAEFNQWMIDHKEECDKYEKEVIEAVETGRVTL